VFALRIVGNGLQAGPGSAGSAAPAAGLLFGRKPGLSHGFHEARGFQANIIVPTGIR
jgi:hypothetical protein